MFNPPQNQQNQYDQRSQSAMGRPSTREGRPQDMSRSASPGPPRSTSPRPYMNGDRRSQQPMPRSASPTPYGGPPQQQNRPRSNTSSPQKQGYGGPPPNQMRAHSPQSRSPQSGPRPGSSQGPGNGMAMQLSQGPPGQDPAYFRAPRPTSQLYGDGPYSLAAGGGGQQQPMPMRPRANSNTGGGRQVTKDGRPILHFARALYMYQAAIPEELSFAKGDVLAVVRHQDDGWWEAEVCSKPGRAGLVPSNYLQNV